MIDPSMPLRWVMHPPSPREKLQGTHWEQGATQRTLSRKGAPSLRRLNRKAKLMQAVKKVLQQCGYFNLH